MRFVLEHALAILFVLLFALGVVLIAALIRDWLNAGPACIECGCTHRRACRGGCYWISIDPHVCSSCGWVDAYGSVWVDGELGAPLPRLV